MANLVLAFAEILAGAVILDAGVKGDTLANVIRGQATQHALPGSPTAGGGGTGVTTGTPSAGSVAPGTYTNPVPGASTGRVDQGVDYKLGSAGFVAPGRSKIVYTGSGGGWGSEYVAGQLLDGPLAGQVWYIAEAPGKAAGIVQGAIVDAGQQITPAGSSTGGAIEAGWANPSNPARPLAQALAGYSGDQSTAALTAGYSFSQFVVALGGIPGDFKGAGASVASTIEGLFSTGHAQGVPYG